MKRHEALVPLSHDHHHGLVEARRLRCAAALDEAGRREAAAAFLGFFEEETRGHFRLEEERLFPLLVGGPDPATELLTRALLEHQRVHSLVARLEAEADPSTMAQLGELVDEHIRFEERVLFPFIEQVASEDALRTAAARL